MRRQDPTTGILLRVGMLKICFSVLFLEKRPLKILDWFQIVAWVWLLDWL